MAKPENETERLLRGILHAQRAQLQLSRADAVFVGNTTKSEFCEKALEHIKVALGEKQ